jgi:site-specific DNA recombinase
MKQTSTPRAALYGRVSQDKHAGRSVSEQQAESETACKANGWTLTATYSDNDISASRFTTKTRPGWAKLVADLDAGKFDVLVLWEPSRGSRELMGWAALLDACRRHKVLVHVTSHQHTYDLSKPRDWRSLAEDGVDSAYESEKSSQRIRRSMASNAVAGRPHGRAPYGYVRRYDPATKALVAQEIDPQTAPVVREIFRRLAAAEPLSVVTKDLNARRVPPPISKQWYRQNIRKLALNHAYIAQRDYHGEIHQGDWPALVTAEDWYGARRVLLDPKRTMTKARPGLFKYLLSYLVRCGVCDEPCPAVQRTGRPAPYYFCPKSHVSAGVEWLDSIVTPLVLARLDDKELMARLSGGDDEAVVAARTEAAELQERLDGFRDAAAAGELTAASLAHVEARLLVSIETAKRKAASDAVPAVLRGLAGTDDIAGRWERLSIAGRRQIVAMLIEVKLDPSCTRGRAASDDYDRVKITWRQP